MTHTPAYPVFTKSGCGIPLVIDLDGTLIATDTLFESLVRLVKAQPWLIFLLPFWLLSGRSVLKARVAARQTLSPAILPYREAFLQWLRDERATGRRMVLATAANERIANSVQEHLQLFDEVIASDAMHNLKGAAKLAAIEARYGTEFVYAGDSRADIPIWRRARGAVFVGVAPATISKIGTDIAVERYFKEPPVALRDWVKALRMHQWVKNVLLFVPLLTAFSFELHSVRLVLLAFLAFSMAASATYIVNDLWDLDSDRAHPRKRYRPFASGRLSIPQGVAVASLALAAGIGLATAVGPGFLAILSLYLVLTSAYSWVLKAYVLLDVLMLGLLYTLRILAGAVSVGIAASPWLLAFSMFIFLSLALVKRCAELVALEDAGREAARGRDYRVGDLAVLWPLGVGAALSAVVVFCLFISAPDTRARYGAPDLLWLVAVTMIYWLGRLWIKTSRGEMHDDPVIYALKDAGSRRIVAGMLVLTLLAHAITQPWLL